MSSPAEMIASGDNRAAPVAPPGPGTETPQVGGREPANAVCQAVDAGPRNNALR